LGAAIGFLFAGYIVSAQFYEPPADPPGSNTVGPLTATSTPQIKDGLLTVNEGLLSPPADTGLRVYEGYTQVDLTSKISGNSCGLAEDRGRIALNPDTNELLFCTGAPPLRLFKSLDLLP